MKAKIFDTCNKKNLKQSLDYKIHLVMFKTRIKENRKETFQLERWDDEKGMFSNLPPRRICTRSGRNLYWRTFVMILDFST